MFNRISHIHSLAEREAVREERLESELALCCREPCDEVAAPGERVGSLPLTVPPSALLSWAADMQSMHL